MRKFLLFLSVFALASCGVSKFPYRQKVVFNQLDNGERQIDTTIVVKFAKSDKYKVLSKYKHLTVWESKNKLNQIVFNNDTIIQADYYTPELKFEKSYLKN
jgi:hypothetical protein